MPRTKGAYNVSDKRVLNGLRKHCVDGLKSQYSMHDPVTWRAIGKRMIDNEIFTDKVHTILAEAEAKWENIGLTALIKKDTRFNTALFKMFVSSKRSFLAYEDHALLDQLDDIEDIYKGTL